MKIHLFGASGTGTTTLGHALRSVLGWPYFDTDEFFWLPSDPPFTQRRPPAERNHALLVALAAQPNALVGGSIGGWGEDWFTVFDLAVFLWLPPALRLHRLRAREAQRYDLTQPGQAERTAAFLSWAAGYDDSTTGGTRTLANHTAWLTRFTCPVLELRGDLTTAERVAAVLDAIALHS